MEEPTPGYFRLAPGRTARLRHACNVTCEEVIRDESGRVIELRGKGGVAPHLHLDGADGNGAG